MKISIQFFLGAMLSISHATPAEPQICVNTDVSVPEVCQVQEVRAQGCGAYCDYLGKYETEMDCRVDVIRNRYPRYKYRYSDGQCCGCE